jgi:hypothetical protein
MRFGTARELREREGVPIRMRLNLLQISLSANNISHTFKYEVVL